MNLILFVLTVFYLAMVIGIYIKLLDFNAPKSSINFALILPVFTIWINILCIKHMMDEHESKNKIEYSKKLISYIYVAIKLSSVSSGILCATVCKIYKVKSAKKVDATKNTIKISELFNRNIINKEQAFNEMCTLFN